ncbi:hypothetical protein EYF80_030985 [Liparis tanakae]|uniref:Uncharacterized protein n=1 Tax=Liparis tanakae TaxID=230148 RepID=A0A4Z2GZ84_9TELE|nr:hypothetical protein EYF80_030985 [Liparis tanakae]
MAGDNTHGPCKRFRVVPECTTAGDKAHEDHVTGSEWSLNAPRQETKHMKTISSTVRFIFPFKTSISPRSDNVDGGSKTQKDRRPAVRG